MRPSVRNLDPEMGPANVVFRVVPVFVFNARRRVQAHSSKHSRVSSSTPAFVGQLDGNRHLGCHSPMVVVFCRYQSYFLCYGGAGSGSPLVGEYCYLSNQIPVRTHDVYNTTAIAKSSTRWPLPTGDTDTSRYNGLREKTSPHFLTERNVLGVQFDTIPA